MAKELIKPYIKHDVDASSDGAILKMQHAFKKLAKSMIKEELETFAPLAAYGVFWKILEFMSQNKTRLSFDDIEVLADDLRIDPKFVTSILEDFELFEKREGEYVSLRLLKDKSKLEEKSASAVDSANTRWLLAEFNKAYKEFFKEAPVLKDEEIKALINYSKIIPDLKTKLRDIIYTLYNLKFDTKTKFKPCANWLLTGNNLTRILNGEFGKLQHKPTEKEIKAAEQELIKAQEIKSAPTELEIKAENVKSKADAIFFIKDYFKSNPSKPAIIHGQIITVPIIKKIAKAFEIDNDYILKLSEVKNA